jgi:hypothetical protein
MRALLEGLNTQARQWSETIVILDNGTVRDLERELNDFRHLEHRPIRGWIEPNIVIAFMNRLSHNRKTEETLKRAESEGIPAFVVSRYGI